VVIGAAFRRGGSSAVVPSQGLGHICAEYLTSLDQKSRKGRRVQCRIRGACRRRGEKRVRGVSHLIVGFKIRKKKILKMGPNHVAGEKSGRNHIKKLIGEPSAFGRKGLSSISSAGSGNAFVGRRYSSQTDNLCMVIHSSEKGRALYVLLTPVSGGGAPWGPAMFE